jgi:parallel beta-helix repeat protein
VTVTDWGRGIAVEDASGGTIRRAIAGGNDEGIAIADSERVRVLDSTATSNIYGIYLDGTTDSRVHNSTARQNKWGVALEGGSVRNRISRTVSTDNSQWDLHSRAESRNNTASAFDTGSGTFSLASTNVRARGSYTGSNVFRSPLAPPAGWNATGTYLEADPIGDTIDGLTAAYTGNAPPASLALWHYSNGSWSKLDSTVNTTANTVSTGPVRNGTVALFVKSGRSGRSVESRTIDPRNEVERSNASRTPRIALEQGGQRYPLTPIGNGTQPVEEFYGYRTPYSSPNNSKGWYQAYGAGANRLERANTSQIFLYNGSDGLSLVFLHDGRPPDQNTSGGTVTADIVGLPASGNWTVQDDQYHQQDDVWAVAPGRSRAHIEWAWNEGGRSDGGAFVGLESGDWQRITIDMKFNERSVMYPFEPWNGPPRTNQVDRWIARSGTGRTYRLDMNRSATLVRCPCGAAGQSSATDTTATSTGTGSTTATSQSTAAETQASTSPSTTAPASTSTETTDQGSAGGTASDSTDGTASSGPAGPLSSITGLGGEELLGLGVLLVALVVLTTIVFRR